MIYLLALCIKIVFKFFFFVVQNATFMCAKASVIGEGGVPNGCYDMDVDGYTISACMCKSTPGYKPCNGSTSNKLSLINIILLVIAFFTYVKIT